MTTPARPIYLARAPTIHFSTDPVATANAQTIYLGPALVPCQITEPQWCYLYKETLDGEWQLLFNQIDGLNYFEGFILRA
ncbi:MAG: DUF4377 domain-containing protein [Deinococcales bacterium]